MKATARRARAAILRAWHAFLAVTIWDADAIPVVEGKTSEEMKRVVLPIFDVVIVVMGLNAITHGMPSFDIAFPDWLLPWLPIAAAWALTLGAATALVGITFPRLWVSEAVGKLLMVVVLGGYASALWVLVAVGNTERAFVAAGMSGLVIPPLWNLARLGRERINRKIIAAAGGDGT